MILPPLQWKGYLQNKLSSFIPFVRKAHDEYSIHRVNQKKCLEIFMEEYKQILTSLQLSNTSFRVLVSNMWHIYEQLECQNVCRDNYYATDVRKEEKFNEVSLLFIETYLIHLCITLNFVRQARYQECLYLDIWI